MIVRAVLDANVCLSGLVHSGVPGAIINLGTEKRFVPITCHSLLLEVRVKLAGKFGKSPEMVDGLIAILEDMSEIASPTETLNVCRDSKDNHVLECAVEGQADVIVSGDKDLLVLHPFRGIRVLAPRQFLDELQSTTAPQPLP